MKTNRIARVTAVTVALIFALSGCSLLGGGTSSPGTTDPAETVDLNDTYWSGTDSVGDFTRFLFQSDGTVGVTYNENEYDDPGDTWSIDGTKVTVIVFINADVGSATYVGSVNGDTMDLSATQELNDDSWTVTLTKE